jgi:hypothetical protein
VAAVREPAKQSRRRRVTHGRARRVRILGEKFRLYPDPHNSPLFALAIVFARRKDLLKFWKYSGEGGAGRARASEVRTYRRDRLTKKFAVLTFWKGEIGSGTVAHELYHATVYYGVRRGFIFAELADTPRGFLPIDGEHERLADAMGHMMKQFVAHAYRLGLYGDGYN